jgi:predicted RNase H-like nuclease (RuvC/YqgF family)
MAIEEDISKAIDANLTSEVSNRLKARLQLAEDLEKKSVLLERALREAKEENQTLKALVSTEEQLNEKIRRFAEARDQAKEATIAKTIVDLKLEYSAVRVADMKELVKDVFANSRFKYTLQEGGTVPVPNPGGYPTSASHSKTTTVEGTGQAPGQS